MAAGGAAAAAIAMAVKASGVVVRVQPEEFSKILNRAKDPLIVVAQGGWFSPKYQYLVSYKGLGFYTGSPEPISLPAGCEVVTAKGFWMPG